MTAAHTLAQPAPPRPPLALGGVPVGGLAMGLGAGLTLGALAVGLVFLSLEAMPEQRAAAETIPVSVGDAVLDVPGRLFRAPGAGMTGGALTLPLPLDAPPGASIADRTLILRIAPADGALDPAERPASLYARFLTSDVWRNPGGLLSRRFRAGSPYQTEELYLAPPDGRAFAARCPRADRPDAVPGLCVAEFRDRGLDVTMSFPARRLPEWEEMDRRARALLGAIRRS